MAMSYAPDATAYEAFRNASDSVAQKFSTLVTGLLCSSRGRESVMPDIPDIAVPSQKASMSCLPTPALSRASVVDSMRRSSAALFQCSPNLVQPIPTMATWSLIPCELMPCRLLLGRSRRPLRSPPDGAALAEAVVDGLGGEQPA